MAYNSNPRIRRLPFHDLINRRSLMLTTIFLLVGSIGVYSLFMAKAAVGQLYIEPSTVNVQKDNNLTVAVKLTTSVSVDSVEAKLSYDPTKLQLVSTDSAVSVFPSTVQSVTGSDYVQMVRGILAPETFTGDGIVFKVTFRALADTGITNLSLSGNTASAGSYLNPLVSSGVVTFEGVPPPPPPPTTDTTPPVVTISNPKNSAVLKGKGKVSITASATDNVSLANLELYIDGKLISNYTTNTLTYAWDLKTVSKGSHAIMVKAFDSSGNMSQTGITITKR